MFVPFSVTLLTNGSLVKPHLEFLKNHSRKNRLHFSVSLDADNADSNALTRGNGSFLPAVEGICALLEQGFMVDVLCTVTRYFSLEKLEKLVEKVCEMGGRQLRLTALQPAGLAKESFTELKPSTELLSELSLHIPDLCRKYGINIGQSFSKCYDETKSSKVPSMLPCKAGITQISIHADGDVYPCNSLNIRMGNIFTDSIQHILHDSEGANILRTMATTPKTVHPLCMDCQYERYCTGGCRGVAYGSTGDLYAPDVYCDQLLR